MIRLLTDDDIRDDILYRFAIDRNHDLIRQLGWSDASLVEQYNLVVSLGLLEAPQGGSPALVAAAPPRPNGSSRAWP